MNSFLRPEGPILDEEDAAREALEGQGCVQRGLGALAGGALGLVAGFPIAFGVAFRGGAGDLDSMIVLKVAFLGLVLGALLPGVAMFFFSMFRNWVRDLFPS